MTKLLQAFIAFMRIYYEAKSGELLLKYDIIHK